MSSSCVSALFWHYQHYDFVCAIDINTHFLLFFNWYIVVLFVKSWTNSRFMKLIHCQFIWHSVIIFQVKTHNISKGKWDILEILILLFDFRILILNFCSTILHTQNLLDLFSLLIFWLRISHNFKNRDQKYLIYYFNTYFTVCQGWRGRFKKPAFFIRVVDCWGEDLF